MQDLVERVAQILIKEVRDRSVQSVVAAMKAPRGSCSLSASHASTKSDTARVAQNVAILAIDNSIESFLYLVDQLLTTQQLRVSLKSPLNNEWVELTPRVPAYQLYFDWIDKYSAIRGVPELARQLATADPSEKASNESGNSNGSDHSSGE